MIYCRLRSHLIVSMEKKKTGKHDDRLHNALSIRGLRFEGCYFYYVHIIVRGSAFLLFWLEQLCNICAFNVMQNTTCMRGEQKVQPLPPPPPPPPPLFPYPPPPRGILHNTRLSPKTTIFLIIVMRVRDETHCSADLSCAVLLMIPQPRGRFQGVNFWTEPFADSSYRKKYFRTCERGVFFFFLCILGVFLFARFISFFFCFISPPDGSFTASVKLSILRLWQPQRV